MLDPAFVWETVLEASDDSTWAVQSDTGARVLARRGLDAPGPDRAMPQDAFTAQLFLAAEFSTAN